MKSAVETLNPTRAKLTVEVPFEELKPSLDAAYKKIAQQINIPGFRKGKVPAMVIDQRVGREAVIGEAVNEALPKLYFEALQDNGRQPLAQPEIDITKFEDNETLEFTAEVDIRPEIELGGAVLRSDLWLANDGDSPTLVRATFRPRAAGAPVSRDMTLLPGGTLFVPDVLGTLFGAGGQGSLDLSYLPSVTGGGAARVRAFSRARSGDLTAGSLGPLTAEAPETAWSAGEQVVAGLPGGDGSVVTLLIDNLEESGGQVAVALFDSTGEPVGGPVALDLGPRASRSLRLDRLFLDLASHTGPFSARIAGSGIRFAAAATLAGGELQAPLFLPAQTGAAGSELLIPRVTRGPGAFNTFQFSRLLAANPSAQARGLRCELWLRGQDGGGASNRVATLTIPPQGSVFVEDVLHDLFGLKEALGALRISWSGEGPAPRVLSLTVSTARGGAGSRFAALVDSRAPGEAATARSVDFGAAPSTFTRASWGAVNLGDAPANLRLSLRGPSGEVVRSAELMRPRGRASSGR